MIDMILKTHTKFMETMAQKVVQAYTVFYNLWNVSMIPKLMKMLKWFDDKAELKKGDIVYIRKVESELFSKWTVGKVFDVMKSKNGVVGSYTDQDKAARSEYKFPNMLHWNEFVDYKQDVLDTLLLVEHKLMLLLCAVNTDFTGLETEPVASVDSSFSPELYGEGHSP